MRRWILAMVAVFALATMVAADPENVSTTEWNKLDIGSRADDAAGQIAAEGGNVSRLNVTNEYGTSFWHGLFGNVSTAVVLNDGSTNFYSWAQASPTGELYFARADVTNWGNVIEATDGNVVSEQQTNGVANSSSSADNLTSTYNDATAHTSFDIGSTTISDTPSVDIGNFEAAFLWNTDSSEGVYAAIVAQDTAGYDGETYDFEVMLPTASTGTLDYYVYAELE